MGKQKLLGLATPVAAFTCPLIAGLTLGHALALVVCVLTAGSLTTLGIRLRDGGVIAPASRFLPILYVADVPSPHLRRRVALDISTAIATTTALIVFGWVGLTFAFVWAPLIAAAHTDLRTKRLPHRHTMAAWAGSVAFAAGAAYWSASVSTLVIAIACGATLFAIYLTIAFATYGKMGMGDVYLALSTGTLAGVFGGFLGLMVAFVATAAAAALGAIVLSVRRRAFPGRSYAVPFGPSMIAGALAVTALGLYATTATHYGDDTWGLLLERLAL